jgi:sirohydrochlorin cobaltochelatase
MSERLGVVLIGHGSPALDCPPQWIGELMAIQHGGAHGGHGGHGHGGHGDAAAGRAAELDAKIRDWPRTGDNDPYQRGLEQLAAALRPLLPTQLFAVGYNEFCRPSVAEAVAQVAAQGASRILVVPTMLTPGGVHSEVDIPNELDRIRRSHPGVRLEYVWPFDLGRVAGLLADHVRAAADAAGRGRPSPSPRP